MKGGWIAFRVRSKVIEMKVAHFKCILVLVLLLWCLAKISNDRNYGNFHSSQASSLALADESRQCTNFLQNEENKSRLLTRHAVRNPVPSKKNLNWIRFSPSLKIQWNSIFIISSWWWKWSLKASMWKDQVIFLSSTICVDAQWAILFGKWMNFLAGNCHSTFYI